MRAFSFFWMVLLLPVLAAAQSPPPHLAGLAAQLHQSGKGSLEETSAGDDEEAAIAALALAAFRATQIETFAGGGADMTEPFDDFVASLTPVPTGVDAETLASELLALPAAEMEPRLRAVLGEARPLADALAALRRMRFGDEPDEPVVFVLPEGQSVEIAWLDDSGKAMLVAGSDGSGAIPEYEVALSGGLRGELDPQTGAYVLGLSGKSVAPDIKTEENLKALRASILGEWLTDDNALLFITSGEPAAGLIARTEADIRAEIDALLTRYRRIRNDKIYLWRHDDTGEVRRQEKFRRLKFPWKFEGEQPYSSNAEEMLAELDVKISALRDELAGGDPPAMRLDPVGYQQVKKDPRAAPLYIIYEKPGLCPLRFSDAWFDGRRLAARLTYTRVCAMSETLPQEIRRKLVTEGWRPPFWLLGEVAAEADGRILKLRLSDYGMKVSYSPDDNTINRVFDPFESDRDTATRTDDINRRYSIARSQLP